MILHRQCFFSPVSPEGGALHFSGPKLEALLWFPVLPFPRISPHYSPPSPLPLFLSPFVQFLRQSLTCSPGWLCTHNHPVSASQAGMRSNSAMASHSPLHLRIFTRAHCHQSKLLGAKCAQLCLARKNQCLAHYTGQLPAFPPV